MIDTVVLTLRQGMFAVVDHDKFSPSSRGLYEPESYYRLGGRSNMVCKQNPTSKELKAGIYKPRLTITKRFNKYRQYEIMMKVEFSVSKLLYGNNFDEVSEVDFDTVIELLKQKLNDMGIWARKSQLVASPVSAIHYSKNIALTDRSTPYTYLNKIAKCNINLRLDVNQTDYRNGHNLKYRANSFEIAFYDKLKDLNIAKTSEKRAEEKDNGLQLKLFEQVKVNKPFEVLRMEIRLNRRQKISQILQKIEADIEPTFSNLFSKEISQKILLYYLNEIESTYPMLTTYSKEPKRFLMDFVVNNPNVSLKNALQALGLRTLFEEIGVREFREIIGRHKKTSWYRLNKDVQDYNYPEERPFEIIRKAINDFTPLKLVDFEDNMINNDKYGL